jgi:light-regulated signal transduction histidine kinase (bacteriophytochrome)
MKSGAVIGKRSSTKAPAEDQSAVSDFALLVAHELEQPLDVALKAALSLADVALESHERHQRIVAPLLRNLGQLQSLVDDLKALQQVDAGAIPVHRELVDVAAFSKEVLRDFMVQHPDRPVEWMCDTSMQFEIDQVWFRRALHEVLEHFEANASPATLILIEARRSAGAITFSFHNKTMAMHEADLESVFRRTITPEGEPSPDGWGLYAARAVVRAHQGKVWMESTPGLGTTAYVALPGVFEEEF